MAIETVIERYDANHLPCNYDAAEIADLYIRACPAFDEEEEQERKDFLKSVDTPEKILHLISERRKTLFILREISPHLWRGRQKIAALLGCGLKFRDDVFLAYVDWLLTDRESRGKGYASLLHHTFENEYAHEQRAHYRRCLQQAINVHPLNPARKIYEKWGYRPAPEQPEGGRTLFLIK